MTTSSILVLIAVAGLFLQLRGQAIAASGPGTSGAGRAGMSLADVLDLAGRTVASNGFSADPVMLAVIAFVESSGNPAIGLHPDGASLGLMGVTELAARDNAGRGYFAFPPTRDALMTAEGSMYHAAAYVTWLRSWSGQARPDEFVVRAYNVGPTGASRGNGASYLALFNRRRSELGI